MAKLEKGDRFPDLEVDAVLGRDVLKGTSIDKLRGGKPTMFWFLRYMGCPPCRLDIHLLTEKKPEFDKKGVNIIAVMQSKPEVVLRDMIDKSMAFPLICDPEQAVYKALDIKSRKENWQEDVTSEDRKKMEYKKGLIEELGIVHGEYEGNEQQRPAWFYVDYDGTVLEAHYGKYTYDMPLADEALAKIK